MSDVETAGIVRTPGTLSGKPRIEGKRIGVLMLGDMIHRGEWTKAEVLDGLDITTDELDAALAYYEAHEEEMDAERARDERARQRTLNREQDRDRRRADNDA